MPWERQLRLGPGCSFLGPTLTPAASPRRLVQDWVSSMMMLFEWLASAFRRAKLCGDFLRTSFSPVLQCVWGHQMPGPVSTSIWTFRQSVASRPEYQSGRRCAPLPPRRGERGKRRSAAGATCSHRGVAVGTQQTEGVVDAGRGPICVTNQAGREMVDGRYLRLPPFVLSCLLFGIPAESLEEGDGGFRCVCVSRLRVNKWAAMHQRFSGAYRRYTVCLPNRPRSTSPRPAEAY